ncbi:MAG: hypothetical protein U0X73_05270 [Thermoanaerobaculia bacterium]
MEPRVAFRRRGADWRAVAKHVLIVVGLFLLGGLVLALATNPADPGKLGEGFGRASIFVALFTAAASVFRQNERPAGAAVFGVLAGLAVVGPFAAFFWAMGHSGFAVDKLTAADRKPFVHTGARLCHASLEFSIPDPGSDFAPDGELETQMNQLTEPQEIHAWILTESNSGERVMVEAFRAHDMDEKNFRSFCTGFKQGLLKTPGVAVASEQVDFGARGGEYRLAASAPGGAALDVYCWAPAGRTSGAALACVQTVALASENYAALRDDLRFGPCG